MGRNMFVSHRMK